MKTAETMFEEWNSGIICGFLPSSGRPLVH
jgi:hypothetical protein